MTDQRPKKLFKVASEFNVATQSIVDTLEEKGYSIANKPNSRITPEMYHVLVNAYGDEDQIKALEAEAAEKGKDSSKSGFDDFLEPIDDLPLEPEEEEESEAKAEPESELQPLAPEEMPEEPVSKEEPEEKIKDEVEAEETSEVSEVTEEKEKAEENANADKTQIELMLTINAIASANRNTG